MEKYLSDYEAKEMICEYGRRMYETGLVVANAGNITCKVSEDRVWATPTMVSNGRMTPDMMLLMDLEGNVQNKTEYQPTSEIKVHLGIYKTNPNVQGVVHAHPIFSTAYSLTCTKLRTDYLCEAIELGEVIPVAPFAMPRTYEVPDSVKPYCLDYNCALMANHGAITWGPSLEAAFFRMEWLENYCHIVYLAEKMGTCRPLPPERIPELEEMFRPMP